MDPNNLFGLHEPHFRVFPAGGRPEAARAESSEDLRAGRRGTLHADAGDVPPRAREIALRASKKRPHQAIAKLMGRVAKTPAAADDNHRAKLFYGRDTGGPSARTSRSSNASSWCIRRRTTTRRAS